MKVILGNYLLVHLFNEQLLSSCPFPVRNSGKTLRFTRTGTVETAGIGRDRDSNRDPGRSLLVHIANNILFSELL